MVIKAFRDEVPCITRRFVDHVASTRTSQTRWLVCNMVSMVWLSKPQVLTGGLLTMHCLGTVVFLWRSCWHLQTNPAVFARCLSGGSEVKGSISKLIADPFELYYDGFSDWYLRRVAHKDVEKLRSQR